MKQTCQLCGGALSPRWNPGDPLRCSACGAGNRRLHEIEEHWQRAARDNHVEEQIALGRDIYAGEWSDTDE